MEAIGLALDTTFDDTSVALLRGHNEVIANLTLSQFKEHEAFGGVVGHLDSSLQESQVAANSDCSRKIWGTPNPPALKQTDSPSYLRKVKRLWRLWAISESQATA